MEELKWHIRRQEAMCATETKAGGVIGLWGLQTCNIIQAHSTDGRPLQSAAQLHCSPPLHSVTPCAGSGDLNNYRR